MKTARTAFVVMLALVAACGPGDDQPVSDVRVGWGGSEGHPSCVYDVTKQRVDAKLTVKGTTERPENVTVTVTVHADENTSMPVGSSSRTVRVDGSVDRRLILSIPVEKAPHVDIDGETACSLSVKR